VHSNDLLLGAEAVVGLIALAIAVAALAERLRTPAPSLLVAAGLGVGYLPGLPSLQISPELVTLGILPPLLFAAAEQVSLPDLAKLWRPIAVLAVGLVVVTAVAVAGVTHAVEPSISVAVAFTLGAILASTDPVAVTALSRRLRLPDRVGTLVQSESLFNDATSLVMFQVAVAAVAAGGMGAGDASLRFLRLAGGGALLGVLVGALAAVLLRRTHDPTVQAGLALVVPYVAAVGAEALEISSVTAVIVTGLMLAERRARTRQPSGRLRATSVYETVVFLLESAIFAVIGLQLATFIRDLPDDEASRALLLAGLVTVTLLAVRALALALGVLLPRLRTRPEREQPGYGPWQVAAVVTWSGARGVIPLAAALSIPLTTDAGAAFPHRPLLLVVATAAVVTTLIVQGTTLQPLVTRLGVLGDPRAAARQRDRARYAMAVAALSEVENVGSAVEVPDAVIEQVRADLEARADRARGRLDRPVVSGDGASQRRLRRRLIDVEADELGRLRSAGEIGADVFRELQHQLDLEAARLEQ
jgi:CPA1 family monovalent cation:H+ antiporter